jgi:membrane protein implicated in regulation of membrane protease activity
MVVLGLLLLLASTGIALGVVLDNTDEVSASAFGVTLSNVSVGGFFLAGAAIGAAALLGLVLLLMGASRKRSRRVETKQQVKRVRTQKQQLVEENEALRAQLAEPYATSGAPETETVDRH